MAILAIAAGVALMSANPADARGPRGGGGGGGIGALRSGGAMGSFQRPNISRPSQAGSVQAPRNASGKTAAKGNVRASETRVARNGNTGVVGNAANSGTIGNGNGNTGVVNTGNVGNGNVNTGDVVAGNNVDVDVDGGWGGYAGGAYATGVAVGTATSTAVASAYYSTLPAGCYAYGWSAVQYYQCTGGTWYQRQYHSGSTVYVAVSDPTRSK